MIELGIQIVLSEPRIMVAWHISCQATTDPRTIHLGDLLLTTMESFLRILTPFFSRRRVVPFFR
jgi:hypothetical protein